MRINSAKYLVVKKRGYETEELGTGESMIRRNGETKEIWDCRLLIVP